MPTTATQLDLSILSAAARREVRDFYQFLLLRRRDSNKSDDARNTRHFADLCGTLAWKGDAVAAQRSLRDEW